MKSHHTARPVVHSRETQSRAMPSHAMPVRALLVMAGLSFVTMYVLIYLMVDSLANVLPNLNQFFMAGVMTAPMVLIELAVMGSMYRDENAKRVAMAASVALFVVFAFGVREQVAIDDKEFLQSMIPHHGAAILMCGEADVTDAEVVGLCQNITKSQQIEIDWMHAKLRSLENSG